VPKVVDKKEKAAAIGRAALSAFRKAGYHRTRMADIAEAAGIGKGTLYEYFDDKADVLHFLFDDYFQAFKEGALRAMQSAASPGARLLRLVEFAFEHVSEWQDHCAVYVDYFGAVRAEDEKRFALDEIYEDMGAWVQALIQQAQAEGEMAQDLDATATSELLLSVFDGVVLHDIFAARRCDRSALRNAALRLLTQGLVGLPPGELPCVAGEPGDTPC
jgi:AcrR family transcriptional regulator